jgi:hypothetical protein
VEIGSIAAAVEERANNGSEALNPPNEVSKAVVERKSFGSNGLAQIPAWKRRNRAGALTS